MKTVCAVWLLLLSFLPGGVAEDTWQMLESTHFQIYHHPHEPLTQEIADIAEDFYGRMGPLIENTDIGGKIEIWVCDTEAQFQAAVHAPIQDWAVGCAFPLSRRIIIQNPRVIIDRKFQLAQVLRHEIVHVLFGQRTKGTIGHIPLWFVEGVAIYLSGEWAPYRQEVLFKYILSGSIIPLAELTAQFPKAEAPAQLAYAESLNAVAWLAEIAGIEKLWEVIDLLGTGNDLDAAFKVAVGWDLATFDMEWQASLSKRYHWFAIFSSSYLFWGSLALVFVLFYLRSRQWRRRKLAELAQAESETDPFFADQFDIATETRRKGG